MKYGITEQGFKRKTFPELLEEMQLEAKEIFGEDANLSNESFIGMNIANQAWRESLIWDHIEDVYFSAFVDFAEVQSLDYAGKYITISRKPATKSKGFITIEAKKGTKIHRGFRVANTNLDKVYEVRESYEFQADEEKEFPIQSIEAGNHINAITLEINTQVNPIGGVTKVYNQESTAGGSDIESDAEFRERYYRSISRGGGSTREAVEAAILDMEEVSDAYVIENDTMEEVNGVPPKALAPVVFGAGDIDIANTIIKNKAGGIQSFGDTIVEVEGKMGVKHKIGFSRPIVTDIYVRVKITKDDGYPGDDAVTRAILGYIGGQDEDGVHYKGLRLGQNVIHSKVMSSIMCLNGILDVEVELSKDNESWVKSNIEVVRTEIATTNYDKVVITHVG